MKEQILHLFIAKECRHDCPLCCNKLYNIDEIPVVTVERLKSVETVCLTGGEPFGVNLNELVPFIRNLRRQFPNIRNLYVYTSGFELRKHVDDVLYNLKFDGLINGINIAPKDPLDWQCFSEIVYNRPHLFAGLSNRLYVFEEWNDFYYKDNAELGEAVSKLNINVIGRKWDPVFNTPDNEHFERLPILFKSWR